MVRSIYKCVFLTMQLTSTEAQDCKEKDRLTDHVFVHPSTIPPRVARKVKGFALDKQAVIFQGWKDGGGGWRSTRVPKEVLKVHKLRRERAIERSETVIF